MAVKTGTGSFKAARLAVAREERGGLGYAAGLLAAAAVAAGSIACLAAAKRGIDLTDESYYLASILHPRQYLRSSTEFQLFLGPVLAAVRYVWILRLINLVALFAASVAFALSYLLTAPSLLGARHRRSDHLAIGAALVVGALLPSMFTPQSPGYDQLTVWTLLCVSSLLVLLADKRVPRLMEPVAWGGVGVLIWMQFLVKWPAVAAIVPLLLLALFRSEPRTMSIPKSITFVTVGFVLAALVTDLYVPLNQLLIAMKLGTSAASAYGGHPVRILLWQYVLQLRHLAWTIVRSYWYLVLMAVVGTVLCSKSRFARQTAVVVGIGLCLLTPALIFSGRARGGVTPTPYPNAIVIRGSVIPACTAFAVVAMATALVVRRRFPLDRRALFIGSFLSMPLLSAIGTNNYIWYNALFAATFWIAAGLALTSIAFAEFAQFPVRGLAIAFCLLIAFTAVDGTWSEPYRQVPLNEDTIAVSIPGPLNGLRVDRSMNTFLLEVRAAVLRATARGRPPSMVAWGLPGAPLAGGAVQPVIAWVVQGSEPANWSIEKSCQDRGRGVLLLTLPGAFKPVGDPDALPSQCVGRVWVKRPPIEVPSQAQLGRDRVDVWFAAPRAASTRVSGASG
jgi:hypothetical protein